MEIPEHRRWMYNRLNDKKSSYTAEFYNGVEQFIEFATNQVEFATSNLLRCPCAKCKCQRYKTVDEVKVHLFNKGFKPNYYRWTSHGEKPVTLAPLVDGTSYYAPEGHREEYNVYQQMVMDAAGPEVGVQLERNDYNCVNDNQNIEEDPNPEIQSFYDMLAASQAPLYDGCDTQSELSMSLWALSLKSDYNMPVSCFDRMMEGIGSALPSGHRMPKNLYYAKKNVAQLGMGCLKIDCCPKGCMLYYKDAENLMQCKFCGVSRYKPTNQSSSSKQQAESKMWYFPIIPRIQRLYSSFATAAHMRWHYENRREDGILCHPSHGEAWKHFDRTFPDFADDPRNVRLGLCADGFNPNGQYGKAYSCWPFILTPYNLPPEMCMKREMMFLTIIIPGPSNPKSKIDIYLEPLIDDLKTLWNDGVVTYDVSLRQNFIMRAALMWTINDFPAYGMLSGWSTAGKLACPICMKQCKGESLPCSKKVSFFDQHRRFLDPNHPYRKNTNAFMAGKVEHTPIPKRLSGEQIWEIVKEIPPIQESQGSHHLGYGINHNWTKQSVF